MLSPDRAPPTDVTIPQEPSDLSSSTRLEEPPGNNGVRCIPSWVSGDVGVVSLLNDGGSQGFALRYPDPFSESQQALVVQGAFCQAGGDFLVGCQLPDSSCHCFGDFLIQLVVSSGCLLMALHLGILEKGDWFCEVGLLVSRLSSGDSDSSSFLQQSSKL